MIEDSTTISFRGGLSRKRLDEALYIGTRAPDNYYHWLINALPALHLANRSSVIPNRAPVLVPDIVRTRPQLVEALEMISNTRPIEYFGLKESVCVRRLFTIDPPPVYDTPLSKDERDRAPLTCHQEAMSSFRDKILESVAPKSLGVADERLFLLRPEANDRAANQEELLVVAEGFGFRAIRTDEMSFTEQVDLFSRAKFVTGPSGAAFSNLLFSSGVKALLYKADLSENQNFFALLAAIGGGEVFSIGSGPGQGKQPGTMTPKRFRQGLHTLFAS